MDMHDRDSGVFAPDDGAEFTPHDESPPYAIDDYASFHAVPQHDAAISGTQLRHRLITPEAMAAIDAEVPRPSLLERLRQRLQRR